LARAQQLRIAAAEIIHLAERLEESARRPVLESRACQKPH
jgi:hypothetical protein